MARKEASDRKDEPTPGLRPIIKGNEGLLLTDKEIDKAVLSVPVGKDNALRQWWSGDTRLRAIAQAQLAKALAKIEAEFFWVDDKHRDLEIKDMRRDAYNKWQALKGDTPSTLTK